MSIRITIADPKSTVSFICPGHAIKMFVAACSQNVPTIGDMLDVVGQLDGSLTAQIRSGLARFDEHNLEHNTMAFEEIMSDLDVNQLPPFRVFSPDLRNASLDPARLGLVLFNLRSKRIVQVQNHYGEINRTDRGRVRISGEPSRQLYRYELSQDWALLP